MPESRIESNSEGEMRDRRRSCLVVVVVAEGEARGGDDEVRDDAREKRCVAAESMGSGGQWQPVRTQSRSRGRGRGREAIPAEERRRG